MATSKLCSVQDCSKAHLARGWCRAHYYRWQRYGDPLVGKTPEGEPMRYFRETVIAYDGDDCLIWPYSRDSGGYAHMKVNGQIATVSRLACEARHGPPPTPAHEAAHSCGKGHKGCVAKSHLGWKTRTENQADRIIHGTRGAKLTEADVLEIREMKGVISQTEIVRRFGVSQSNVSAIVLGVSWAWLGVASVPNRAPNAEQS